MMTKKQRKYLKVIGKYTGTGKSQLALNWGNKRKNMIVVCPANVLCDEIKKQDYTSITVHTLLGKRPQSSSENTQFQPFDV